MHASPIARVAILVLMASSLPALAVRPVIHVRASAPDGGNGASWETPYNKLQDALAQANAGDDIWVAAGTYRPDEGSNQTNDDRSATFTLKNDVAIYGGFGGQDSPFSSRNPVTNVTVLSGDLTNTPASNADNSLHVVTGTLVNNTAILDGFTITGGNANVVTEPDCSGSAINCIVGSPKIQNCIISGNVGLRRGGAAYLQGVSTPSFTGCTFSGNSNTDRAGGAVFVTESTASFVNCTFSSNESAGDGGALYLQSCAGTLTNCTFNGNESARQGGAILIENSTPVLTGCSFTLNTATVDGGAIFADRSIFTLTNCQFTQNSGEDGGAIYNSGSSPTLTDCTFTGNTGNASAGEGGAIGGRPSFSSSPMKHASPVLNNCTFTGNSAGRGGAITLNGAETSPSTPSFTGCTFTGNTATTSAGAALLRESTPVFTSCSFTTNSATAQAAGALVLERATSAAVTNCTFHDNEGVSGGAIHLNLGALAVSGTSFTANSTTIGGGAVTIGSRDAVTFTSCSFSGNSAPFGGAASINGSGAGTDISTWTNCSFTGNSATSQGGALDAGNASPVFLGCVFSGNASGGAAAAVYCGNAGSPVFTNITVSGNSAENGGALAFNFVNASLTNCIVFNNRGISGDTTSQNTSLRLDNGATATFSHSLIANFTKAQLDAGASPDTNLAPADPLFVTAVNPASAPTVAGNLRLKSGSPAINAGSNAALSLALDLGGNPRVFNSVIDLGAYENQGADPFLEDLDGDGVRGGVELAIGTDPAVSDAGNPRHLRILPGSVTFGHAPGTAATIALELRRSTDLINFNVVASSVSGFPAAGPGGIITITDPSPPAGGKAFYRLQASPR